MGTQFSTDSVFDRLVDGELPQLERRHLLESLEQLPDGWRRCALAFLEGQSLREEIGFLARSSQHKDELSVARAATPASIKQRVHPPLRRSVQWLAIAASVLLAFGLGWIGRERGVRFPGPGPSPDQEVAQMTSSRIPSGRTNPSNAITLLVHDNSGRNVPVRVPLVDADTLDRQFGTRFQPSISDDVRKQLQDQGFTVQSKRQYAPLWFENGRPMLVPVEDTKIVPVNNKVF